MLVKDFVSIPEGEEGLCGAVFREDEPSASWRILLFCYDCYSSLFASFRVDADIVDIDRLKLVGRAVVGVLPADGDVCTGPDGIKEGGRNGKGN